MLRVRSVHAIDRELLEAKVLSLYALCQDHAARYEERLYLQPWDPKYPLEGPLSLPSGPPEDDEPHPRPKETGGCKSHHDPISEEIRGRGECQEQKLAGRAELRLAFVDWIGASRGRGPGSSAFCLCTRGGLGPGEERDTATAARWPRWMPSHGAWLPPHMFAQHVVEATRVLDCRAARRHVCILPKYP